MWDLIVSGPDYCLSFYLELSCPDSKLFLLPGKELGSVWQSSMMASACPKDYVHVVKSKRLHCTCHCMKRFLSLENNKYVDALK